MSGPSMEIVVEGVTFYAIDLIKFDSKAFDDLMKMLLASRLNPRTHLAIAIIDPDLQGYTWHWIPENRMVAMNGKWIEEFDCEEVVVLLSEKGEVMLSTEPVAGEDIRCFGIFRDTIKTAVDDEATSGYATLPLVSVRLSDAETPIVIPYLEKLELLTKGAFW